MSPFLLALLLVPGAMPAGESLRLPVTRDTWFSNVGPEADGNNGGAPQLKIKSHQEMSLIDFDPTPLRGRVVKSAQVRVHRSSETKLLRMTVGTFASEWTEGTGRSYEKVDGASTHNRRAHPDGLWAGPGSDLCAVMLGNGHTTWSSADAGPMDAGGFQSVPVAPKILAARVAGISNGLLLFDDTGSEWGREGEKFTPKPMPNRYMHSKDSNRTFAPHLIVELGGVDRAAPGRVTGIESSADGLPAGEAIVSWITPKDQGEAGTIGFFVKVAGKEVPRYEIPTAGLPGARVRMHLRDLVPANASTASIGIRAVDGAGNLGPETAAEIKLSTIGRKPLPGSDPAPFPASRENPRLGSFPVAVLDELDKVAPQSGELIPAQAPGYLTGNHLWNGAKREVRLHAARNEFTAFQVLIQGRPRELKPSLSFNTKGGGRIKAEFGRFEVVPSARGPLPDPIVPWSTPAGEAGNSLSLHAEVYVPHDAEPGLHEGTLTLKSDEGELALRVALKVWDFTLPDYLSFLPEMNCYGLPANERDYYRLAHAHRVFLNRVPYSQRGEVADGCAPVVRGGKLDWTDWDRRFGPLLDGSAFADLPRKGVPIEAFYLPIHENWPTRIEPNYNGSYWADQAFTASYRKSLVEISRDFARHFDEKRWNEPLFEFFLNGKNDFKKNGWSRASAPWILDEPSSFQDFWALRWFGLAFHEGTALAGGSAKMVYRCDISRPQWQRDTLDGLLDVNIVGGAFRSYRRLVLDRKRAEGQVVIEYASSNPIEQSNVQPAAWSVDAWTLGSDGVLPWQTVGNAESWKKADTLSLFYPARASIDAGPIPSVRLKSFRRGQQDVEYLTLLALATNRSRWEVAEAVRGKLKLSGERKGTGFTGGEDAGLISFSSLKPADLWSLRVRVGEVLSGLHPEPRRRLVEFRTPRRDAAQLIKRESKLQPITVSP